MRIHIINPNTKIGKNGKSDRWYAKKRLKIKNIDFGVCQRSTIYKRERFKMEFFDPIVKNIRNC